MPKRVRHILSLSGGKDSAALAIYLRDKVDGLEYVFCDTRKELPETYDYLRQMEALFGIRIVYLHDDRGFDHHLQLRRGYLPSPRMRWCTQELKLRPFEAYVGNDEVINYVGLRYDEDREGYISSKKNIKSAFPFKEDHMTKRDVIQILETSGLGLPSYYSWRWRSGCYFCFFQQRIEWVGLLENHPDLFEQAKAYEKVGGTDSPYTWVGSESLEELSRPERVAGIREEHQRRMLFEQMRLRDQPLINLFGETLESWQTERACPICDI